MAYLSQYEIDMQQDARNRQNQSAIGNAVNNSLNMLAEQDRKRALETKRKAELQDAQGLAFAKDGIDQESIAAYQKGDKSGVSKFYADLNQSKRDQAKRDKLIADAKGESALYEADQLKKPITERDDYIKSIDSAKARSEISSGVMADKMLAQENMRIEAEKRKLENERQGKINQVKIQDFDLANPDEVIPSQKDAEAIKNMHSATNKFSKITDEIKDTLGKLKQTSNPMDQYKLKLKLDQKVAEARLEQKEIKKLGVLNGPDLPLVDSTLGDASSITKLLMLGPDEAAKRIEEAKNAAFRNLETESRARGYKRKAAPKEQPQMDERAELEALRKLKQQSQNLAVN